MSAQKSNCLFVILPELYDAERGYELGVIWPGLEGVYSADFYCGHDFDLAVEWANEINLQRNHTPQFVSFIVEAAIGLQEIHFFDA